MLLENLAAHAARNPGAITPATDQSAREPLFRRGDRRSIASTGVAVALAGAARVLSLLATTEASSSALLRAAAT